jgi:hypothetical protein
LRIIDASLAKEVAGDSSPCDEAFAGAGPAAAGSEPLLGDGSDGNFARAAASAAPTPVLGRASSNSGSAAPAEAATGWAGSPGDPSLARAA